MRNYKRKDGEDEIEMKMTEREKREGSSRNSSLKRYVY